MANRRQVLKAGTALGTVGVIGGAGVGLFAQRGRASINTSFDAAGPVAVTDDTGDVQEVFINPTSNVQWENFDVPVTKVRQLLEARLMDDGTVVTPSANHTPGTDNGWWPIYRESPWLFRDPTDSEPAEFNYNGDPKVLVNDGDGHPTYANTAKGGTTGHIDYPLLPSTSPDGRDIATRAILIASEDWPMPDYSSADRPTDYLEGTSIGQEGGLLPAANGSYGTVGDTSEIDNPTDGSTNPITVELRLTTTVHTDYDFVKNPGGATQDDTFAPLAMGAAPDVPHKFGNINSIPYHELRAHSAHPAVSVQSAQFAVEATNEPAESGSDTNANPGAN